MNLRLVAALDAWRRLLCLVIALLWLADRIWPLPLPKDDLARVVLAEDGTPLWRFADANGVWRYPVQTSRGLAVLPGCPADLRRPLVLPAPRRKPVGVGRARPGRT